MHLIINTHAASHLRKQNQPKQRRKISSFFSPLHAQTAVLVNRSANGAKLYIVLYVKSRPLGVADPETKRGH